MSNDQWGGPPDWNTQPQQPKPNDWNAQQAQGWGPPAQDWNQPTNDAGAAEQAEQPAQSWSQPSQDWSQQSQQWAPPTQDWGQDPNQTVTHPRPARQSAEPWGPSDEPPATQVWTPPADLLADAPAAPEPQWGQPEVPTAETPTNTGWDHTVLDESASPVSQDWYQPATSANEPAADPQAASWGQPTSTPATDWAPPATEPVAESPTNWGHSALDESASPISQDWHQPAASAAAPNLEQVAADSQPTEIWNAQPETNTPDWNQPVSQQPENSAQQYQDWSAPQVGAQDWNQPVAQQPTSAPSAQDWHQPVAQPTSAPSAQDWNAPQAAWAGAQQPQQQWGGQQPQQAPGQQWGQQPQPATGGLLAVFDFGFRSRLLGNKLGAVYTVVFICLAALTVVEMVQAFTGTYGFDVSLSAGQVMYGLFGPLARNLVILIVVRALLEGLSALTNKSDS